MEFTNINPNDVIFALDIGTRSVIGTVGVVKDKKFQVISEKYVEHEERAMIDGQIHDISLVASGVSFIKKELERELGFKLLNVSIAAAGRFLRTTIAKAELKMEEDKEIDKEVIRSLELTAVKTAEEQINKLAEGKLYCVGYSVKSYYLNGYVITNLLSHKGENISAEIIATFLPRSVVESLYAVMNKVDLNVVSLTLEPIAAMEAAVPQNLRLLNLALVDIGAGTSDIAISSKDTISAYGMVSMAGDEVTEAVAQTYLVDFNTAERMKRECSIKEKVTYIDVLGLENEVLSEEVIKVITPIVDKISDEVSKKIIELNGGKAPNAVFLVGGGAHTPNLKENIAVKLNLPVQRIGIKGREAVSECVCLDNNLGSIGVTVLGIALISIRKMGHDFIDITLNDKVVSLFNSHKHTVMDVIIQGGVNPKIILGKNGKNLKFTLNDIKRVAFGTLATSAIIKINDQIAHIDSEVKEGDNIEITCAKDGKDAAPKAIDYILQLYSLSFFLNDEIKHIEPIVIINEKLSKIDEEIKEGDIVNIIYPTTLLEYKKYFSEDNKKEVFYLEDIELNDNYIIKEGDRIYSRDTLEVSTFQEEIKEKPIDEKTVDLMAEKINIECKSNEIFVVVNDNKIKLKNKEKYIFIDVFDYIDFDLQTSKGNLVLLLNKNKANYYDDLSPGDEIKIYWE